MSWVAEIDIKTKSRIVEVYVISKFKFLEAKQ